ncbi:MAG: MBL fold metallo-hydrolase [Gammaproteobacteria bacterium]
MKIRFWGVRGSIPTPGPAMARYGGNTTCIEIRTDEDDLIILDGGSGIYPLAQALTAEMPLVAHVFITHTHWDHIHGLPFFTPLFISGNEVNVYGGYDVVAQKGIEHALSTQFQYSYFPIREAELKARIRYFTIGAGESVRVGNARVTPTLMNHPVLNYGYRVECGGKSAFFTGDHEPHLNIYEPDDEQFQEYEALILQQERTIFDGMRDVNLLIADSSYTIEEYPKKKGWGHGTFDSSIRLAQLAGARRLVFTHFEPTRTDMALEAVYAGILEKYAAERQQIEFQLAREGAVIEL